jgi:CheY-like chemotaxis protein
MDSVFSQKTAKVVVVDPSSTRRFMLLEAIRNVGFSGLESLGSGKDLLSFMEVETPDWIIMPLHCSDNLNALQVLKIATSFPRFRRLRVSILLQEDELYCLPLAFEHGLMSWHPNTSVKDVADTEMRTLVGTFEREGWDATLVAATYLRKTLTTRRHNQHLLVLEQDLCQQYPGNARQLLHLAEAQALTGAVENAVVTLGQVTLLAAELSADVEHVRNKYIDEEDFADPSDEPKVDAKVTRVNALGIATCVVIDSDTTVQYALSTMLKEFGVPHVQAFNDGGEAWAWLKDNPEPGLIISEWRLPGLPGPLLVQRIRSHPYVQVPIVVVSSLIKANEVPLVQEVGVSIVIEKPFDQATVIRSLAWVLQQHRHPTEQFSLERRMRQQLELGQTSEAARLMETFSNDGRISAASKTAMEAEFAYAAGQFVQARDLAIEAIKLSGDSLMLFNLLGKCMLKTGEHENALKCFSKAQETSPLNIERLCRIAEIHHDLGQHETEAGILDQASGLDPDSPCSNSVAANLALLDGNSQKAKALMAQLDSTKRLLALMNNRAVAMTKGGQFEAGIDLYRRTLEALPAEWSRNHDAIAYNLGLAYAKYGELGKAQEELSKVHESSTGLKRKAQSLERRIKLATERGLALNLSEDTKKDVGPPQGEGDQPEKSDVYVFALFDIRRGDLCCHLIYRALDLADVKSLALLAKPPAFRERQAIVREETFGNSSKPSR